jgi:hypothetical protein
MKTRIVDGCEFANQNRGVVPLPGLLVLGKLLQAGWMRVKILNTIFERIVAMLASYLVTGY